MLSETNAKTIEKKALVQHGILRMRQGHGANCSSIGSVIDLLFATAAVGGAVFAAISATLSEEPAEVVVAKSDQTDSVSEKNE